MGDAGIVALLFVAAYLLGSIPTAYILGHLLQGIDIRQHGSGSIGATNALRVLGKGPGITALLIDCLKGVLAVFLAYLAYNAGLITSLPQPAVVALVATLALLGHSKSVWVGFSGGKSVATGLGVLLAMDWRVALGTLGTFLIVFAITRIVSAGSISGAAAVIAWVFVFQAPLPYQLFAIAAGLYVIWRHKANIQRLLAGTEPRIGQKMASPPEA